MLTRIHRSLRSRVLSSAPLNRLAMAELASDRAGGREPRAPEVHLDAALAWLERAHDAPPDAGVSRGYCVGWKSYWGGRGWQPSYPETTGYIIPTFFDAAARLGRPPLAERAVRMADWEIEVQLPSGAVMGGVIGQQDPPTPAVFNTGQVMLGWIRAYRETGRAEYLEAARRAGDYLLGVQDADGAFRQGRSEFARADCSTYYTRVAWPLCLLGRTAEQSKYVEAGVRNLDHHLERQRPNGWFEENCLEDPLRPILHTIAYAARGVLEAGLLLERDDYVEQARLTAAALAERQRPAGGLAGRYASDWSEAADWECLTGNAQTAILWARLGRHLSDASLLERAREAVRFVCRTQNLDSEDPGLRGGIKGSFPLDGDYAPFETLNWAAKFTVDALLLTLEPSQPGAKP